MLGRRRSRADGNRAWARLYIGSRRCGRQLADAGDFIQPHVVLLHRRIEIVQPQLAVAAFITGVVSVLLQRWLHGHGAQQAAAIVQGQLHLGFPAQLEQQGFQEHVAKPYSVAQLVGVVRRVQATRGDNLLH